MIEVKNAAILENFPEATRPDAIKAFCKAHIADREKKLEVVKKRLIL